MKTFHHNESLYVLDGNIELSDGIHVDVTGNRFHVMNNQVHYEDGPAVEWANGRQGWFQHGKRHRIDGPAKTWPDGDQMWYQHGKRHREDGPAVLFNGRMEWWLNGYRYRNMENWAKDLGILNTDEFTMIKLEWG